MALSSASRIALVALAFHAGSRAGVADDLIFADGFDECRSGASRACYEGPIATMGIGVCQAGVQYCVNGTWGPCTSQRTPSFESCNGLDDDCNGIVDDGLGTVSCGIGACARTVPACGPGGLSASCVPGPAVPEGSVCDAVDNDCDGAVDEDCGNCMRVSPFGNDVTGDGSPGAPFRTIGVGITRAAAMSVPRVCVAVASTCAPGATVTYPEAVIMENGVSVYGQYESTGWSRCANTSTVISAQNARGVCFGPAVSSRTILDGFRIDGQAAASTAAAITVEGSTGALISNNVIDSGAVSVSYGVNVVDSSGTPATPTIYHNRITGGAGSTLAVAVRSLNSAPVIQANCAVINAATGHCTSCGSSGAPCLVTRSGGTGAESYAVRLESSPGARVEANGISGAGSSIAAAGVRVSGAANGTVVHANFVLVSGTDDIAGVWLEDCEDAAPWVFDNQAIYVTGASSQSRAEGVRAVGACHPRIDGNDLITGSDGVLGQSSGVRCGLNTSGTASLCSIIDNGLILGSASGFPVDSVGVRCEGGACARVEGNGITGRAGQVTRGLIVEAGGTFVDSNVIQAGCATSSGIGLLAVDSFARIQNNRIEGVAPATSCVTGPTSSAVVLSLGAGLNQVDLHSNDLVGGLVSGTCTSRGLAFDLEDVPPTGARGLIRNNIVSAGTCSENVAIDEMNTGADPRVLQNNDLWAPGPVTALYRDEVDIDLTTIAAVNALGGLIVSDNISADPLYTPENTLSSASPCRDAGILTGAPPFDFQGQPRPQGVACDIGRDEFTP
jgi:hypothetical protein